MAEPIGLALEQLGEGEQDAQVVLSRELVGLLSAQLYQSPIKAIEELVVNSYDADADRCCVSLGDERILVFDDGIGMDSAGIQDLWHIGHSAKRSEAVLKARKRRQIGKFGIGKLATAAIANRVTYVTKPKGHDSTDVLSVSVDYSVFEAEPRGGKEVTLKVRRVLVDDVLDQPNLADDLTKAGVDVATLAAKEGGWTLAILESLKPESQQIKKGRLRWVLSTAMPLTSDFHLFLGGEEVVSSKQGAERVVEFEIANLTPERLTALDGLTGEHWESKAEGLVSPSFPQGIRGTAYVTRQTLFGKSDDLERSHGFFVRVLGRLLNLDDPLFGVKPSSHAILNRFRAEVEADDLDHVLTAPREDVELSDMRTKFLDVLNEIFNQARSMYEAWQKQQQGAGDGKQKEHARTYVNPRLVERPLADALLSAAERAAIAAVERFTAEGEPERQPTPAEISAAVAESGWFYVQLPLDFDLKELTESLYNDERAETYTYDRISLGRTGPLVQFVPTKALFQINTDHDLVRAHDDNPAAVKLLDDLATSEALLEVYLREQGLDSEAIEELLTKRDDLLRSLTKDRIYSLRTIAGDLREASDAEHELEVQLIIAARALGFVTRHVGGSGTPDGVARLHRNPDGEVKVTLEAKSTGHSVVGLAAVGFDALEQHVRDEKAAGCLLVAPGYPGTALGDGAAVAKRANEARVSCWTVEQLARVVESVSTRHITAAQVLDIVLNHFAPSDVEIAVEQLLSETPWSHVDLYRAILGALHTLEGRLRGRYRTPEIISTEVSAQPQFRDITIPQIEVALRDMTGASEGGLAFDPTQARVIVHVDLEELERRLAPLLGEPGAPRHQGMFTAGKPGEDPGGM